MTVIDFMSKQAERESAPPEGGTEQVKKGAKSKVFTLARNIQRLSPQIHPERINERDLDVKEFFDTLVKEAKVRIISTSKAISQDSILRVGENPTRQGSYDMKVKDFVRITEPRLGGTESYEIEEYLLDALALFWIRSKLTIDPNPLYQEREFSETDLETFFPEVMTIAWETAPHQADWYDCMISTTDCMGIFVSPRIFTDTCNTPLLHMLMHAREEYLLNGYDMKEEHNIELCLRQGMYTDTTNIPLSFLEPIIIAAIKRTNPLYTQTKLSDKEIMRQFYQKQVIPTLAEYEE